MITTNFWKGMAKACSACLIFLCLWVMVPGAWAAYEVNGVTASPFVAPMIAYAKCAEDITVSWTKPAMTGVDVLNGYFYKWNDSKSSLNDVDKLYTEFSVAVDGTVAPDLEPPNVVKDNDVLADLDSGNFLYLHIMTWYTTDTGPRVSADVVYGPFLIDNTAPNGTIIIVDASGNNEVEYTSDTNIYLKLAASKDPATMYLSETPDKPSTGQTYATDAVYGLGNTIPGVKTIHAWFEDAVGNISLTTPATDSVTLQASINISPNTATLDLATGATKGFRVEGTDATYNWTIINEALETGGAATPGTIAQITVGGTATNSVTVQGLAKGTFRLQAVPTIGTGTLTSGTIAVVQNSVSKTFTLLTTAKTNVNAIGFVLENTGITTAHELGLAVGNCDLVSRWDEATQSYSSHPMAIVSANNFPLVVGKAYFVSVTTAHDFTLTGALPSSKTVNLVTTAKTNVNAVGIPKSKETLTTAHQLGQDIGNVDLVSRWDVPTQSYSSHPMAIVSANNFAIQWGNGYFVSVTQNNTTWNW